MDSSPKQVEVNGPGAYNPDYTVSKKKAAMTRIGTSLRPALNSSGTNLKNPGPGNYSINTHVGKDTPK